MRKRVFSIFLAILVFFSMPVNVYATGTDHGGSGSHHLTDEEKALAKLDFIKNFERDFQYILCQLGALSTSNFKQLFTNFLDGLDMKLDDYLDQEVSIDDDGEVVLSSDLIASIKQALKEYQQENFGYMIQPTVSVEEFSSYISNGVTYRSLVNIVKDSGIVAVYPGSSYRDFYLYDLSPYVDGTAGFVYGGELSKNGVRGNFFYSYLYDFMTWQRVPLDFYTGLYNENMESSLNSLEELKEVGNCWENYGLDNSSFGSTFLFSYGFGNYDHYFRSRFWVVTPKGSDVLIFNSLDALKNYSINKRTVFTTSKFYEDTGDLTLSVDRMNETLKDMNGLLEQFRSTLPSDDNLTEDQLEKLLGAFLDEFFARYEQSGGGGSGSGGTDTGGGSGSGGTDVSGILGFLESILQALEDGFTGILMYLDEGFGTLSEQLADIGAGVGSIDESLEGMTQEQAGEMTESFLSTVTSAFGEIGALLKTKFPFSLPWDLQGFLSVLGGGTVEVQASDGSIMMVNAYADGPPASAQEMSDSGAPVFRLPLVVASAGIREELVVDLSPFEYVHVISRGMLTVLYCLALMNLTFKVVELGKGLVVKDD